MNPEQQQQQSNFTATPDERHRPVGRHHYSVSIAQYAVTQMIIRSALSSIGY